MSVDYIFLKGLFRFIYHGVLRTAFELHIMLRHDEPVNPNIKNF